METRTLKYKDLRETLEKENAQYQKELFAVDCTIEGEASKFVEKYEDYFNASCDGKRAK
jgi:hypothetical protein